MFEEKKVHIYTIIQLRYYFIIYYFTLHFIFVIWNFLNYSYSTHSTHNWWWLEGLFALAFNAHFHFSPLFCFLLLLKNFLFEQVDHLFELLEIVQESVKLRVFNVRWKQVLVSHILKLFPFFFCFLGVP